MKMSDKEEKAAITRFVKNIEPDQLEAFLEDACQEKFDLLLAMMRDPEYRHKTLAQMAKLCHLSLHELQSLYIDGMRQLALLRLSTALPDIMEDVTVNAKDTMESCPRCDGLKIVPFKESTRACPTCKGSGEIRRIGDKHARDLVFQSAKLTGSRDGPMVAIQQNFISGGDERMENMLKKTRQIVLENKDGK